MPFQVSLPPEVRKQGWKVKILDRERLEPPHVTIIYRVRKWRMGLRDAKFLVPPGGTWKDIPDDVRQRIDESWDALVRAWDTKYPENPVKETDHD